MKGIIVLAALFIIASFAHAIVMKSRYDENDVFVLDLKLFTGSTQYFIKGVDYSPQPLGKPFEGGFCSAKINYEQVYYNACLNDDYFNAVDSDNGGRPHPNGPWFLDVWERDLPVIKELGANTIRIYHMGSILQTLGEMFPANYSQYSMQYASKHRLFFDTCAKYGLKVIAPIVETETVLDLNSDDTLYQFIEATVEEIGNHSALLMWVVGNELGLNEKPELLARVNKMMNKVRTYTYERWNRILPVTTCVTDLPSSYDMLVANLEVDLFMSNAGYRYIYMESLWQPDPNNHFIGWAAMSAQSGLPLLVGEFGMPNQDQVTLQIPDWINQQYKAIVEYMPNGSIGGLFFEFNEESMKPPNQATMGLVKFTPAIDPNNPTLNSTQPAVFIADILNKKPIVFESLQQGLSNSSFKQYSYASNPYELAGTQQIILDLSKITPTPLGKTNKDLSLPEMSSVSSSQASSVNSVSGSTPEAQTSGTKTPQPSTSSHKHFAAANATATNFLSTKSLLLCGFLIVAGYFMLAHHLYRN
jgi:hypothetical protein